VCRVALVVVRGVGLGVAVGVAFGVAFEVGFGVGFGVELGDGEVADVAIVVSGVVPGDRPESVLAVDAQPIKLNAAVALRTARATRRVVRVMRGLSLQCGT
jgi:hypothetical protein